MDLHGAAILKSTFATLERWLSQHLSPKTEDFEKTINIEYFCTTCRNFKFPLAINFIV